MNDLCLIYFFNVWLPKLSEHNIFFGWIDTVTVSKMTKVSPNDIKPTSKSQKCVVIVNILAYR